MLLISIVWETAGPYYVPQRLDPILLKLAYMDISDLSHTLKSYILVRLAR